MGPGRQEGEKAGEVGSGSVPEQEPRLRRRVMQIFREVKDALGSDWKGLDVKFSVVRNSRYALNFVYVNHFKSRGRIRKLTSKVSDLE